MLVFTYAGGSATRHLSRDPSRRSTPTHHTPHTRYAQPVHVALSTADRHHAVAIPPAISTASLRYKHHLVSTGAAAAACGTPGCGASSTCQGSPSVACVPPFEIGPENHTTDLHPSTTMLQIACIISTSAPQPSALSPPPTTRQPPCTLRCAPQSPAGNCG